MSYAAKPLYRRVNTRTHGVRHGSGQAARYERGGKRAAQTSMHSKQKHGLDFTPLYKFLQNSIGQNWDEIRHAIKDRIPDSEPLFHTVALRLEDATALVRTGESSYFHGLYVDDAGVLARVAPNVTLEDVYPACACCTHTLNGARFLNRFDPEKPMLEDSHDTQ